MTDPRHTVWSVAMDDRLTELWGTMTLAKIGAAMVLSSEVIRRRSKKLGLELPPRSTRYQPTAAEWTRIAREHAIAAQVAPSEVMAGCRRRTVLIARWKAWAATLALNPKYSANGLARISGFDHTTIMHAMRRLPFVQDEPVGTTFDQSPPPVLAPRPRLISLLVPLESVPVHIRPFYRSKPKTNINIGADVAARRIGARA